MCAFPSGQQGHPNIADFREKTDDLPELSRAARPRADGAAVVGAGEAPPLPGRRGEPRSDRHAFKKTQSQSSEAQKPIWGQTYGLPQPSTLAARPRRLCKNPAPLACLTGQGQVHSEVTRPSVACVSSLTPEELKGSAVLGSSLLPKTTSVLSLRTNQVPEVKYVLPLILTV